MKNEQLCSLTRGRGGVRLLRDVEVAEELNISASTLRRWRQKGSGPPYRKIGTMLVRYHPDDVTAWTKKAAPGVLS